MAEANPALEPPHEEHHSWVRYLVVWIGLVILTIATYSFSRVDLGAWSLIIAMAIATAKSLLVVLFFMHLIDQKGAYRMVLFVCLIFVGLLMSLTLTDVATRFPWANPPSGQIRQAPLTGPVHNPTPVPGGERSNLDHEGQSRGR